MTDAWRQAGAAVLAAVRLSAALLPAIALAETPTATPPATQPAPVVGDEDGRVGQIDDASVRGSCDALVDAAVRRPYGWAWTEHAAVDASRATGAAANTTVTVAMRPGVTPAAGLVLYHAGRRLHEPRYVEAAVHAARGVVAAQDATGRVPARAGFGRSASSADAPAAVPDRGPTRAALGLLLTLIHDEAALAGDDATRERFRSAARRAGYWLLKQQTSTAAWPLAYPPDAPPGKARRILRLDTSDYRLSTIAVLAAGDVLDDDPLRFAGGRAAEHLQSLRATDAKLGRGLWGTSYHLGGGFDEKTIPDGAAVDLLASREAMLTLLTHYLLTTDGTSLTALEQAADSLRALAKDKPLDQRFPTRRAPPATTAPAGVFTPEPDPAAEAWTSHGGTEVLQSVERLQQEGRAAATAAMAAPLTLRERLCAALCELPDAGADATTASATTQPTEPRTGRRETRTLVLEGWRTLDGSPRAVTADR